MANQITESNINLNAIDPSKTIITKTSRYINSDVIYYGPNNIMTFTTYKRVPRAASAIANDQFMVIPPGMEYRPDLLSQQQYGVVDYWYKIMEVNGMYDIYDFKIGTNIRVPNINSF